MKAKTIKMLTIFTLCVSFVGTGTAFAVSVAGGTWNYGVGIQVPMVILTIIILVVLILLVLEMDKMVLRIVNVRQQVIGQKPQLLKFHLQD